MWAFFSFFTRKRGLRKSAARKRGKFGDADSQNAEHAANADDWPLARSRYKDYGAHLTPYFPLNSVQG